jgi:iron complex transport system ATP-binding protein
VKGDHIAAFGTPEEIFTDDIIKNLYDIESGSFNAMIGNIELASPDGDIRCFVVGGGGYGIPYYRALQKRGVPFVAGILSGNDIDLAVAEPLAKYVVKTPHFVAASSEEIKKAEKLIDSVGTVIDCGCPTCEYNRFNSKLINYAAEHGKVIIKTLAELRGTEL